MNSWGVEDESNKGLLHTEKNGIVIKEKITSLRGNYEKYYELVMEIIPAGAFILLDNVLWSGKVLDNSAIEKNRDTKILHELNMKITDDKRVENILLPIRDGLMLVRKL